MAGCSQEALQPIERKVARRGELKRERERERERERGLISILKEWDGKKWAWEWACLVDGDL